MNRAFSEIKLPDELLARVDAWRSMQEVPLSLSQAVAELVKVGLRSQANPALTLGDKLILSVLCDMSRSIGSQGTIDPEFLDAAVKGGHAWAIEWEHPSLAHAHTNSQTTADFVVRVLSMWKQIEEGFSRLSATEQEQVRRDAGLSGNPAFPGWHSELEANYKSTARFMTDRMELFPMFKDRSAIESPNPVVDRYKTMLGTLAEMDVPASDQFLNAAQLTSLLRVR